MNLRSFSRPTWVEINLSNLKHNLEQIKFILNKQNLPQKTSIVAVVKTNAYGHGLVEISKKCIEEPAVSMLGVTSVEEGITLREEGITLPILILGTLYPFDSFKQVIEYNLIPTIASIDGLKALAEFSKDKTVKFHLEIDTGMGRIGILPSTVNKFLNELSNYRNIELSGVFTHFSSADSDEEYTKYQINEFETALKEIKKLNSKVLVHSCNSAAMLKFPQAHYDFVRPGLCIYGLEPFSDMEKYIKTSPVLSWKAKIVFLKKLPEGKSISYGRTFITNKKTVVATIPVGYGDGYNRKLSNIGEVIVKNTRAPIIGRVTMDMTMIDVTHIKDVRVGDEVTLIGGGISVEDIAKLCGTINYEVVCNIHPRVPRIFVH